MGGSYVQRNTVGAAVARSLVLLAKCVDIYAHRELFGFGLPVAFMAISCLDSSNSAAEGVEPTFGILRRFLQSDCAVAQASRGSTGPRRNAVGVFPCRGDCIAALLDRVGRGLVGGIILCETVWGACQAEQRGPVADGKGVANARIRSSASEKNRGEIRGPTGLE